MPEIVSLPNSAHVWSHSSAALPTESESSDAHTGGKPLALEIVLREGRLAGELGLSSWADGGCPTGALWGAPWWGPEAEGERESERVQAQERAGALGGRLQRGDRLCAGGCAPRGRHPWVTAGILGLGQLFGRVERGAAGPEGAWWGLSSAVLTRGAGGPGASAGKGSLRPCSQVLLRLVRWEGAGLAPWGPEGVSQVPWGVGGSFRLWCMALSAQPRQG